MNFLDKEYKSEKEIFLVGCGGGGVAGDQGQ